MVNEGTPPGDEFGEFGVLVHTIVKSTREQVRISLNEYKGAEYIDVRSFYQADGGFRPSRRGITLPIRLYPDLLEGVLELGPLLGFDAPESPPGNIGEEDDVTPPSGH